MWKKSRKEGVRRSFSSPFSTCLWRWARPVQTLETLAGSTETDVPVIALALGVMYPGSSETSYQGEEIISQPLISQLIYILFLTQLVPSSSSWNGLSFWKDEQRRRKRRKSEGKQKFLLRVRADGCMANRLHCWPFGCIQKVQKLWIGPRLTVLI